MRQQEHRPPKTQKVGIIGTVPERYGKEYVAAVQIPNRGVHVGVAVSNL